MSTLITAIYRASPLGQSTTPFCDQSFRGLRVLARSISRLCLAVFYHIAACIVSLLSNRLSHRLHSLSLYHWRRARHELIAFVWWRSQIVDFACNSLTRVKELSEKSELDLLKETYGEKEIAAWSSVGTAEIPLDTSQLKRREMVGEGGCLGENFSFASHYLKEREKGKTPLEAVKETAPRYAEGVPDEAQLAQIFYTALIRSQKGTGNMEGMIQQKTKVESLIARKMGLSLKPASFVPIAEGAEEEMTADFQRFIDRLPDGPYLVGSHAKGQGIGHALLLIKEREFRSLHEPNYATLKLSKEGAAREIWNVGKAILKKKSANVPRFISFGALKSCYLFGKKT